MARAVHRTARAALIYQHAAEERNAVLAEAMDALVLSPRRISTPANGHVSRPRLTSGTR